jgi:hypothetical protein
MYLVITLTYVLCLYYHLCSALTTIACIHYFATFRLFVTLLMSEKYADGLCAMCASSPLSDWATEERIADPDAVKPEDWDEEVRTALHCTVLYCTALYYTVLYCSILHCTVQYCSLLCFTLLFLYCTALYSSVLFCSVLYYAVCTVLLYPAIYCSAV